MLSERILNAPVINYDVAQDQTGYIWLASELDGLQRFDGYDLFPFPVLTANENNHERANVNRLIMTKDGLLWVSTWGLGFSVLDQQGRLLKRFTQANAPDALPSDRGQTLFQDQQRRTWLATVEGLRFVDSDLQLAPASRLPQAIRDIRVWQMQQDTQGNLWLASSTGLYRLSADLSQIQHWDLPDSASHQLSQELRCLLLSNGGIWIGTQLGLYWFDLNTQQFTPHPATALIRVNTLFQDEQGLWVGTSRGLYLVDTDQQVQHFLGSADIRQLYLDHTQVLWISSRNFGVFKRDPFSRVFEPHLFPGIESSVSLPERQLQSLQWLHSTMAVSLEHQLLQFDPGNNSYQEIHFQSGQTPTRISGLVEAQGELWAAADSGLYRRNAAGLMQAVNLPEHLPADAELTSLYQDKQGWLWFGLWEKGLVRWRPGAKAEDIQHFAIGTEAGDAIIQIQPDRDGLLLVTRFSGLYRLSFSTGQVQRWHKGADSAVSLPSDTLLCAEPSPQGGWWLCTDHGLFWLDLVTNDSQLYSKLQGLPDQRVIAVKETEQGQVWVNTRQGVARFDRLTGRFQSFGNKDGLPALALGTRALLQADNGMLWIGSHQGLFRLDPQQLASTGVAARMVISKLEVDQKVWPVSNNSQQNPIILPSESKRLHLNFSFLEYYYTELHQYQYRLLGVSEQWQPLGSQHQISFNNLPAGIYQFEVTNSTFPTEANTARLYFQIPMPFWQDNRLLMAASLLLMLAAWWLWHWRGKRLLHQNQRLNLLVSQRTQALADANEALAKQARTDFLTRLPNRLAFSEQFQRCQTYAVRWQRSMALVLLDIDHFKQINDLYGHDAGDYVLIQISQLLTQRLRKQDVAARWGGEEFILLLPETGVEGAVRLCEELRQSICQLSLNYQHHHIQLTGTIGVVVHTPLSDDLEHWYSCADQALYQGKRSGRDRVVLYRTDNGNSSI